MRIRRLSIIAFVVAATSVGIPSQVQAAPSIPASLMAVRTVAAQVLPGETRTVSIPIPWRVNMVGVSYAARATGSKSLVIAVRAHSAGAWSVWQTLDSGDSEASGVEQARASHRITTDPLWVSTADRLEVQIANLRGGSPVRDVRVHLINSQGDGHPQNVFVRALHAVGRFLSMRAAPTEQPAEARTIQPAIISRAQWGANSSYLNLPCPGIAPDLKMVFVHHTDGTNNYTKSQSAGIVRGIYAYHTNSRGYCDIGYNFLIDKYGQIFEGRSGGITKNVIGAHTGGFNYGSFGVSLMGQYSAARPTTAMLNSLVSLIAWRLDIAHVSPIGTVTMTAGSGNDHLHPGTVVRLNRIAGHRDVSYTNCPGNYVYSLLTWIRNRVNAVGLPKIYGPTLDRLNMRPDGDTNDEMVRFTAGFSGTVNWTLTFIDPKGAVQRTFTGTSGAIKQYWSGLTAGGSLVANGLYTWKLDAHDSTNHWATGASGTFNIVTSHPDGTLLSDANGPYVIDGGAARPVDPVAYASNFGTLPAVPTGPRERARYTTGQPLGLREGTLLADTSTSPAGYFMWTHGALHAFKDGSFAGLGYSSTAAIPVSASYLSSLGTPGSDITSLTQHPDGTLVKSADEKSFWVIEAGSLHPISALSRASSYRPSEAVFAAAGDPIIVGPAFPVRDGTFIKATDGGAPWIVSDGTKHRFISSSFAAAMGYTSSMMLTATAADLNAIPTGAGIG